MVGDCGSRWCRIEASACPLQRVDMAAAADCTVTCPADFRPWQTGSEDGPMGDLGVEGSGHGGFGAEGVGDNGPKLTAFSSSSALRGVGPPSPPRHCFTITPAAPNNDTSQIRPTPGRVGMRWLPCGAPGLLIRMQVQGVLLCAVVAKSAGSGSVQAAG
ncbi:hypothetical protein COCSADRAFT_245468 [Bipolaris sorokiniana ND90Pr]|uniref:Uncharacterized protein n=1 Tax=Cochliobolus sativus (strain ND90Pr / ATCC 201652) TaxID=665912 RepID=M2SUE3_COCSN|nr:uncharacterized protein COCSADRAFT_245468 [Bipolaris sorokiniana ND90Pr]EMD60681.1 hypothetical protein COCSADRAFT_245468 [Bipolaris sorokiniana ND90Pr]